MKKLKRIRIPIAAGFIFFMFFCLHGGVGEKITYPAFYKYHVGDQSQWSQPDFDDSQWPEARWDSFPTDQWRGIGWLRYELEVDASLRRKPLGFAVSLKGAAEIYLDGRLIYRFGTVAASAADEEPSIERIFNVRPISFQPRPGSMGRNKSHHVLAVRYSSFFLELPAWSGVNPGVEFTIDDTGNLSEKAVRIIRGESAHQMFLMGVYFLLGLLHLMLFLFSRKTSENLYFSLFSISSAAAVFFAVQAGLVNNPGSYLHCFRFLNMSLILLSIMGVRFLYALLFDRPPKIFLLLLLIGGVLFIWNLFQPIAVQKYVSFFTLLTVPESIRSIIARSRKKIKLPIQGTWIIGIGAFPLIMVGLYQIFIEFKVFPDFLPGGGSPRPFYAILVLMISMSIFLARRYALTSRNLEAKLVEVRELSEKNLRQERERIQLEAENDRKNRELEEARKLQLSMLPKTVPVLPHLEIGVFMKTATEVGGDYYDFFNSDDGTLTAVIGDATGHGLQAGTMVTAAKSLFNAFAPEPDPVSFLKKTSKALKKMGFRKMFMAMTIAKFRGYGMEVTAAGMPFPMVYHAESNRVQEVVLKGMPLGSVRDFPYKHASFDLAKGDTILFMSDGLPETFNLHEEMLGFERIKALFLETAGDSVENIIAGLVDAGKEWAGGGEAHDDVTLMVIKMK
jgi:serine phosphatase RsbU (regulator of sigma subunit)